MTDGRTIALKEEPAGVATSEFEVLRRLEKAGLPAVSAIGLSSWPDRDEAILATEYLAFSIQYRRLLMRFPLGPGPYRDRLLDAMASLLVDLHRAGVYWGDCSLANTLFRRDGDKIQAYLVDAETSEIHPTLSDGQRLFDLDILVENVGFGLADLGAMQGREDAFDDAIEAAEGVRGRYLALWSELHDVSELSPDDRQAVRARIRRLNDLGFAVDEIKLEPTSSGRAVRLRVAVANRRFHPRELERLTGIVALEGQARMLLNDIHEYQAWLEREQGSPIETRAAAARWLSEVYEPVVAVLGPIIGPRRDGRREDAEHLAPLIADADRPADEPERVVHPRQLHRGAMPEHDDGAPRGSSLRVKKRPPASCSSGEVGEARGRECEVDGRA